MGLCRHFKTIAQRLEGVRDTARSDAVTASLTNSVNYASYRFQTFFPKVNSLEAARASFAYRTRLWVSAQSMDQFGINKRAKESTSDLLASRDPHAIEELLKRYRPLMRAIIDGEIDPKLQSKLDSSDIVQEACAEIIRVFPKIETTRPPQFIAFVRQVLVNKLNDVRRRFVHSQKRDVSLEEPHALTQRPESADKNSKTPLEIVLEYELWERTELAMNKLPAEVRKVIELRFIANLTFVEIGDVLGRSEDNVRISMGRWLKRIRAELISSSSSL